MQVVVHCTNLQRCLLRRCPVTEEALHLVAKNCTNLRHLSISGINTLTDGHLVGIALKLKHLEHLDIGWNLGNFVSSIRSIFIQHHLCGMMIMMFDLYITTYSCAVLKHFYVIIIPDSDLLQSSPYLNCQGSIQLMLPL